MNASIWVSLPLRYWSRTSKDTLRLSGQLLGVYRPLILALLIIRCCLLAGI